MKVLLISANREKINMPTWPLGLACVATAVQEAGHRVELVDLMAHDRPELAIRDAIESLGPELVGISVRNIDDQKMESPAFFLDEAKEAVMHCRAFSEVPIVVGGAGYSIFPEAALAYLGADLGIQGEGESAFCHLIQRVEGKGPLSDVPGLHIRGQGLQGKRRFERELDRFPLPGVEMMPPVGYGGKDFWFPVQTRRGCPMRCSYCSTEAIEGCLIRRRSPKRIVEWIRRAREKGFSRFHFVDNTFNLPPSYATELCALLAEAELDVQWRGILYPAKIHEGFVRLMAKAGCKEVSVGSESGSPSILRQMNKRFKTHEVREACRILSEYGIERMGFLMLGGPGETKETVEESLHFADSLDITSLKITLGIRVYPYTEVAEMALEQGIVKVGDPLLFPTFYMAMGLGGWLRETIREWAKERPHWII